MEETQTCPTCGKVFTYQRQGGAKRKYCSTSCARRADTSNTYKRISDNSHKGYLSGELIARYKGRCAICGWRATEELLIISGKMQKAYGNEIHHIVSVKDGGRANEDNLILLCPNHHKQADLGIISIEELRSYLREGMTDQEKQAAKDSSVDAIAAAIFGR